MAHTTSLLRAKQTTEAQNNEGIPWTEVEAAMELILLALAGSITVNSSENLAQVNGHTVTEGAGVNGNGTQRMTLATDDALNTVLGTIAGAAVITDASGSVQQYLRGLVKLAITAGGFLTTLSAGSALVGKVGIDQTTPGTTNATQLKKYTGAPSSASILTADGDVFTLAANEIGFIQVLSADAPLAVKLGTGASTSSLNFVLAAGTAASDGKGGAHRIDYWTGIVSVAKMTGTSSYLAWKQAP